MEQASGNCLPFPAEIRNRIYEFALAVSHDDSINDNSCYISYEGNTQYHRIPPGVTVAESSPTSLDLSLLLVSRQTYQETRSIFYRINKLCFRSMSELCTFLRKIGPSRCRSITRMTFSLDPDTIFEAVELLRTCKDLASIEVRVFNTVRTVHLSALCTLRGIKNVEILMPQCPYPRSIGPICYCDGPWFDIQEMKRLMTSPRP